MARVESSNLMIAHSGVDKVIQLYRKQSVGYWQKMAPQISTKVAYERLLQEADFGTAAMVNQLSTLPVEDFETPYFKDFYPIKRAMVAQTATESEMSDLYGIIAKTGKKLYMAVEKSMEVEAAGFVNLATSAATPDLGVDGVALASAAHPLFSGVATNILTANPLLSYSGLELARSTLMTQLSHKGDPMMFDGPFTLFVPPALISVAERLLHSQTFGVSGDATHVGSAMGNDKNIMNASKITLVVNPWFTNTTAWMLRSTAEDEHGWRFITRRMPQTQVWQDRNTDSVKTGVTSIFCKAVGDWRGTVYSNGSGS